MRYALGIVGLVILGTACVESVSSPVPVPNVAQRTLSSTTDSSASDSLVDDYVYTPAGLYHRSCVHELPAGARVNGNEIIHRDGSMTLLPTCHFPHYSRHAGNPAATDLPQAAATRQHKAHYPTANNWIEYVYSCDLCGTGNSYRSIAADWTVPASPVNSYSTGGKRITRSRVCRTTLSPPFFSLSSSTGTTIHSGERIG